MPYSPPYAPLSPASNQGLDQEGEPLRIKIPQNFKVTTSSDSSKPESSVPVDKETILQVEEPKPEEKNEGADSEGSSDNSNSSSNSSSSSDSKKIILSTDVNENSESK
jgi:hypothetical protein